MGLGRSRGNLQDCPKGNMLALAPQDGSLRVGHDCVPSLSLSTFMHCRRKWQPTPGKNTGVGCHFLLQCVKVKAESEVTQSCPILSDPLDCSRPGSSIHGIFQARVLEWGAIAFSDIRGRLVNKVLSQKGLTFRSGGIYVDIYFLNGSTSCL